MTVPSNDLRLSCARLPSPGHDEMYKRASASTAGKRRREATHRYSSDRSRDTHRITPHQTSTRADRFSSIATIHSIQGEAPPGIPEPETINIPFALQNPANCAPTQLA